MKKELPTRMGFIMPVPNIIVSCRDKDGRNNALVVGFAGNVSYNPPIVMIGIVPDRFSYHMIKESGEFIVNLPTKELSKEYDYLGKISGKDEDKFAALNLKWEEGRKVNAPILSDCPMSFECKVVDSIKPGTHELFFGEVVAAYCDESFLDSRGIPDMNKFRSELL